MRFPLPGPVLTALERLNAQGHAAYVVGGCVRDFLRGQMPHDYDICVSCTPRQTHACFAGERVIDTGIRHGTVTVILAGMPLEITTFRADGDYLDGRHPSTVRFTQSLAEDLARRDFTVNAMAYHPRQGVIDLFGGQKDLLQRVIRCVGDADARLTEDALRILRALRFAARLGFTVEPATADAMRRHRDRLALISRERVSAELRGTLVHPGGANLLSAFSEVFFAALPDYPPAAFADGMAALRRLPGGDEVLALSALLSACGPEDVEGCMASLKPSKALAAQVAQLAPLARQAMDPADTTLILARLGSQQFGRLLILQQACGALTAREADELSRRAQQALDAGLPLRLQDLPVNGADLRALGLSGPALGDMLTTLHHLVLRGELSCDRQALLTWAKVKQQGDSQA